MVIVWVLGVFICSVALDAMLSFPNSFGLYTFFETIFQASLYREIKTFLSHIPPLVFFCGLVLVFVRATGKPTRGVGKTVVIACLVYVVYCIAFILLEGIVVSHLMLGISFRLSAPFADHILELPLEHSQVLFWTYLFKHSLGVLAYGVATRLAIKEKLGVGTRRFIATCALLVGGCLVLSFFNMKTNEAIFASSQMLLEKPFWTISSGFSWQWALGFLFLAGIYSWGVLKVKPLDSMPIDSMSLQPDAPFSYPVGYPAKKVDENLKPDLSDKVK